MTKKLLFILNEPTYFVSHRLPVAIAAQKAGFEVHVASGERTVLPQIQDAGFIYHFIPLSRSGRNIAKELLSLVAMMRLMIDIKPSLVHLVTIKPVIYGSFAARLTRVPAVVAAVSGLGYAFIGRTTKAKLLRTFVGFLYRHAFRHRNIKVIFQNEDDEATLITLGAIKKEHTVLIRGSGVDLTQYDYKEEPNTEELTVVMASRLLRDKGVVEYVEAATFLKRQGIHARFILAGRPDPGNPTSITEEQLNTWHNNGNIEYIGYTQNIADLFSNANLVVLPSYREGLPRVLAEAAACGRAVITTNVPGCRAAILPHETGLLVMARDPISLSHAIQTLIQDNPLRHAMGKAGRAFAKKEFDITKIVAEHMHVYQMVTKEPSLISREEVQADIATE